MEGRNSVWKQILGNELSSSYCFSALCFYLHTEEEIKCRENKDCDFVELSAKWDEVLLLVLVLSDSDTLGFHLLGGVLVRSISVMPTPSSV